MVKVRMLVPVATLMLLCSGFCFGAETQPGPEAAQPPKSAEELKQRCKDVMAKIQAWRTEMKQMDEALDKKVAAMNAAQGEARINAMSDVINELVTQRKTMREKVANLRQHMMDYAADHAAVGSTREGRNLMAECRKMMATEYQKEGGAGEQEGAGAR